MRSALSYQVGCEDVSEGHSFDRTNTMMLRASLKLLPAILLLSFASACSDDPNSPETKPDQKSDEKEKEKDENKDEGNEIAPNCEQSFCAEVEVAVDLECEDPIWEHSFTTTTRIEGLTTELSCDGDNGALRVGVSPASEASDREHAVWFKLRDYTGPGTYDLFNTEDDNAHIGLEIFGKTNRPEGQGNREQAIGTNACFSSACKAIVAEGSEPIPNDPMSTHEFRVRVEIHCDAGSKLYDMQCEESDVVTCSFASKPTLRFDLACRQ